MTVRPKHYTKRVKPEDKPTLHAAEILNPEHPVHNHFKDWLGGCQATKRKARAFLAEFPYYREARSA